MLSEYILERKIDVMAITETWLREGDDPLINNLCPPSYKFMGIPRPKVKGCKGGGIGFVLRENIDASVVRQNNYKTF